MPDIKVRITSGKLYVETPFQDLHFVDFAKRAQGKWSVSEQCWIFDVRNEPLVRKSLMTNYGGDGTEPADVVSILVEMDTEEFAGPVDFCGRIIARAWGRNSGAKLGCGVVMLKGYVKSGGSRINWRTIVKGQFLVHDFPRVTAEQLIADPPDEDSGVRSVKLYSAPVSVHNVVPETQDATDNSNTRGERSDALASLTRRSGRKLDSARKLAQVGSVLHDFDAVLGTIGEDVIATLNSKQIAALADRVWASWYESKNIAEG